MTAAVKETVPATTTTADITNRNALLKFNSGSVEVISGPTDLPVGCLQNTTTSGSVATKVAMYGMFGIRKLKASAAIAQGAQVMGAAGGKIATWATGAGRYRLGIALEAASADGDDILVLIVPTLTPAT